MSLDPPDVSIANISPYITCVGGLVILYCTSEGKPIPKVQWFKDDTAVTPLPSHYQQAFLPPTTSPHTTVYTCKGVNYAGNMTHTRSANITINVQSK